MKSAKYPNHGFTLIETLISLTILIIFFGAVASIIQGVLENIGQSRVRVMALSLAQERMELIRNLSYQNVGTIGGIPEGTVSPTETVLLNGITFTVTTSILFVDDPYDSLAPTDTVNTDYKRARVEITWNGSYPSRIPLALVSLVTPKLKEMTGNGGTLSITVVNASGIAVSNATVVIDNTVISPAVHMTTLSDAEGKVIIPGATPCTACYKISVTKSGYSTDRTYSTGDVANPIKSDATVQTGDVTLITFAIDEVSTMSVQSFSLLNLPQSYVPFSLRGNKIIGYDTHDNPVPKFTYSTNTGLGIININNLEWDTYTLDFSSGGYALAGSNPILPIAVSPKTSVTLPIVVVPGVNSSMLVVVRDHSGTPLASASAVITNTTTGQTMSKYTPATGSANFGQAFFGQISPSTYDLVVSLPGYTEATSTVTVNANIREDVTLSQL